MKKLLSYLAGAVLICFQSCHSKSANEKDDEIPKVLSRNDQDSDSDLKKAALQYCSCLNDAFSDLNPALKDLMTETADTKDPAVSLANELKAKEGEEYEMLASELKTFAANTDAKDCGKTAKKQPGIDIDDDVEGLKKILKIMKSDSDCEFPVVLLKHSINSKERRHKREQQSLEEE